jgi:hypothetical protein
MIHISYLTCATTSQSFNQALQESLIPIISKGYLDLLGLLVSRGVDLNACDAVR